MAKIHFDTDYMCGAHPEVMEALVATNALQTAGYGSDDYTERAKEAIRCACSAPDADVWFFVGGTQTNATVIDGLVDPHMGVIATQAAHINVHEGGAIEASGHKVITLPEHEGKMHAADVEEYMRKWNTDDSRWHTVIPAMVYISMSTELGTVYKLAELERLAEVCRCYDLRLYVDGARLTYALQSEGCDVTLADMARIADVFYIGGTKAGLLFGEAVVAKRGVLKHFFTTMKLHGAVLAKGRLLGMQFLALFSNDLYGRIGRQADELAMRLRDGLMAHGFMPVVASPTNQQFFVLPNEMIDRLHEVSSFEYFGPRGEQESMVRFVTGWETTPDMIDRFLDAMA